MAAVLEEVRAAQPERSVVIIGQRSVQNRLVADVIDERLGCGCHVRPIVEFHGLPAAQGALALLDVEGMSAREIDVHVRALMASGRYDSIALMNADECSVWQLACAPGVRGVFFRETSREHLINGLKAMLGGEYWLPRSVLAAHSEETCHGNARHEERTELTRKEAETLELLAAGHSNSVIAHRLGVSPHTVKTHLYNLFRKIGAKNRVQAVKWGIENFRLGRGAG